MFNRDGCDSLDARLVEGWHDVRHFAVFTKGLDSVRFDNEPAHHWVCFSSTPFKSKGCGWGSWELFSGLPPSTAIFLLLVSNANRIQTHEFDRARLRDYYTIMKGFL